MKGNFQDCKVNKPLRKTLDYTTIYSKDQIKTFANTVEGKNKLEELLASGDWSTSSSLFDANVAKKAAKLKEENLRSRPETKVKTVIWLKS